ncbi:isoprenylcysteine carboxylmethyltransferase family protein [uncultured Ferrimonas sp.]|uniref:methyltransferase family protein n=1 Tax=uncultured Ferrimonas sp. TaxID=432640 RepID=UPI00260F13EC|nr:isoprenylcysteine carboxylmethyltransferase family protein [uncultured Ferrimonas sp.]
MNWFELKLPPPLVALACAALVWPLRTYWPLPWQLQHPLLPALALALVAAALLLAITAVVQFRRQHTTVHPFAPEQTKQVITHGVYRFSRNPMYLAMAQLPFAAGLWLQTPLYGLLTSSVFVLFISRFQIIPEEQALSHHFGQPYQDYLSQVRRWL